jgi:hypothetical protein
MYSLNALLKKYFKESGLESGLIVNRINKEWSKIVGNTIAAHTSPESVKGKLLVITVDTPQWLHHLGFYKDEISEKLKQFGLTEIKFRLGKTSKIIHDAPQQIRPELSEDDIYYIEKTLKGIHDPELREKLEKLITHGLREEKKNE